jgi:acetyltransferase-like isoleucine patch superfamily enzyme
MSHATAGHQLIAPDVRLGRNVRIHGFVNLYGCAIGDETRIGPFVEIQKGATAAGNPAKILRKSGRNHANKGTISRP